MLILEPCELRPRRESEPVDHARKPSRVAAKIRNYCAFIIPRSNCQAPKQGLRKTLRKPSSSRTEIKSHATASTEPPKPRNYLESQRSDEASLLVSAPECFRAKESAGSSITGSSPMLTDGEDIGNGQISTPSLVAASQSRNDELEVP
jgi:hypothetical protein